MNNLAALTMNFGMLAMIKKKNFTPDISLKTVALEVTRAFIIMLLCNSNLFASEHSLSLSAGPIQSLHSLSLADFYANEIVKEKLQGQSIKGLFNYVIKARESTSLIWTTGLDFYRVHTENDSTLSKIAIRQHQTSLQLELKLTYELKYLTPYFGCGVLIPLEGNGEIQSDKKIIPYEDYNHIVLEVGLASHPFKKYSVFIASSLHERWLTLATRKELHAGFMYAL